MNVGLNNYQVSLAGVAPAPVMSPYQGYQPVPAYQPYQPSAYTPSYSLNLQPTGQSLQQTDNYEATRDKGFGDFAKGFFVGAGKAVYDMGHGLFFLGKTAASAVAHPIESVKWVGGAVVHGVSHPIQTATSIVTLPYKVAKGIVKPYSEAFRQGKYGEAFGRLTVDIGVIAMSMGMSAKPSPVQPPTPIENVTSVIDDVATHVDDVAPVVDKLDDAGKLAGSGTSTIHAETTVTEAIKESLNGSFNGLKVESGATVNINIGNMNGLGTKMSHVSVSSGGGGVSKMAGSVDDVAKTVSQVKPIIPTPVVTPPVTPVSSGAVGSVSTGAQVAGLEGKLGNFGSVLGRGVDKFVKLPGQLFHATGDAFNAVGRTLSSGANAILHPIEALRSFSWPGFQEGLVKGATSLGNGLRAGADVTAKGLLYAAQNPAHAALIAGATGRAGKATEDVLKEFDLVR